MNTSFLRTFTTVTGEVVQGLAINDSQLMLKFIKHLELTYKIESQKAKCLVYNGNAEKLALYSINPQAATAVAIQVSATIPKEFNLNPIGNS